MLAAERPGWPPGPPADELCAIAASTGTPWLQALAAHATGAVLVAEGDAGAALTALRRAWRVWHELDAPYEAARTRVVMGEAGRLLGDEDGAELEFDAARWVFEQLGAAPDLARVQALSRRSATPPAGGLTGREVQVLRLIAAGKTNRAIAADLFLSDKTVARHVSNIFAKLGAVVPVRGHRLRLPSTAWSELPIRRLGGFARRGRTRRLRSVPGNR